MKCNHCDYVLDEACEPIGVCYQCLPKKYAEAQAALNKINEIRNSIIGTQTINWSEHIYPLVAALNEAGMEGLHYPEAKENIGTLLDVVNGIMEDWAHGVYNGFGDFWDDVKDRLGEVRCAAALKKYEDEWEEAACENPACRGLRSPMKKGFPVRVRKDREGRVECNECFCR